MKSKLLNSYFLFLILAIAFFIISLLPYYQGGKVILGQEGNNILDFATYLDKNRDTWQTGYGTGYSSLSINASFPNVYLLILLQKLTNNLQLVNFVLIFSLYFLPFSALFLLCRKLRSPPFIAFLVSLFYVVNPFTTYFLFSNLSQWNVLILFTMPLFFWLILKFYNHNLKLFFYFGITSLLSAFVNVNPPLILINQIAIVTSIIIVSYYLKQNVSLGGLIKKYLLILTSFLLFNFWWIINWFSLFFSPQIGYTTQYAISLLRGSGQFVPALWSSFTLTSLLSYPANPEENALVSYYSSTYAPLIMIIPMAIIFYFLFKKRGGQRYHLILATILFMVGVLSVGVKGMFGGIYEFLVLHLPLFNIFKTAREKWGVLFVFLLAVYLIFIFKEIRRDKFYNCLLVALIAYLVFMLAPFINSNFLPDSKATKELVSSKRFSDKDEYKNLRNKLNSEPDQFRVLTLPGSMNYQVALNINGNNFYTGYDPVMLNTRKAFITPYSGWLNQSFSPLYNYISTPYYLNLMGFYNIKKIVINKDLYPWFGFSNEESIPEIEAALDHSLKGSKNKIVDLYDVGEHYLPRFYVPDRVVYAPGGREADLPLLVSRNNFSQRSAFLFGSDSEIGGNVADTELTGENASETVLVSRIQSVIDEEKLKDGVAGIDPGGVLFPYVRWKPGSFLYSYVQEKEQKIQAQTQGDPRLSLDQHLLFAAKRISEIQKWNKGLTDQQFSEILKRCSKELQDAMEDLKKIKNNGEDIFLAIIKLEVSLGAYEKRLKDVLKGDNINEGSERFNLASSIFDESNNQLDGIIKEYSTKYYFNIPQDGEYEILSERLKGSDFKIENITSNIDKKFIVAPSSEQADDNWLSFGKKYFSKGKQLLSLIDDSVRINLLTNDWKKLENRIELGDEVKLSGQMIFPAIYQDINNWEPGMSYKLSFSYNAGLGSINVLLFEKMDNNTSNAEDSDALLVNDSLTSQNNWKKFNIVVKAGYSAKSARIVIFSNARINNFGEAVVKETRLEPIIEPKIILDKINNATTSYVPKITFMKINATKYVIDVESAKSPYFLVFSESYHIGWKAYLKTSDTKRSTSNDVLASYFNGDIKEGIPHDIFLARSTFETWGKKSLPESSHFIMNGYANSWYITTTDANGRENYQIIIEYWPQRSFYIGIGVVVLTILGVAIVGLIKIRRRRGNALN